MFAVLMIRLLDLCVLLSFTDPAVELPILDCSIDTILPLLRNMPCTKLYCYEEQAAGKIATFLLVVRESSYIWSILYVKDYCW